MAPKRRWGGAAPALRAAIGLLLALAGTGAAGGAGRTSSWHTYLPKIPSAQGAAAAAASGTAWTTVVAADGGPVPLGALEPAVRLPWHEEHDETDGVPAVEPGLTLVSVTVTPSTVNYQVGPPPRTVEIQGTPWRPCCTAVGRPPPLTLS